MFRAFRHYEFGDLAKSDFFDALLFNTIGAGALLDQHQEGGDGDKGDGKEDQ